MWRYLMMVAWCINVSEGFCPNGCYCDEKTPNVKCIGARLEFVPYLLNPDSRRINLAHNLISSIAENFKFYNQLEFLDLSHNRISQLEPTHFSSQSRLRELKLSHNNVSFISTEALEGLVSLQFLDLSHNSLTEIPASALSHVTSLKILLISHNKLHSLTPKTFSGLKDLRILDICDNYFRRIPSMALQDLLGLETLQLCQNRLSSVSAGDLPLPRLKFLSLENNNLIKIDNSGFHQLQSLQKLNLNNNMLDDVPTLAFASLLNLEYLYLSRNNFSRLDSRAFRGLSRLLFLEVSRCPLLRSIGMSAIDDCINLQNVTISHNPQLFSLPTNLFSNLPRLKNLDLRTNNLRTLSKLSLPWTSLQFLDLRENPLVCNCSLQWLSTALTNPNTSFNVVDVQCSSPEKLKGVYISRLSPHQLRCVDQLQIVVCVTVISASSVLLLALTVLLCRYKRKQNGEKLGRDWVSGHLAPWSPDDEHSVATRHIMADDYYYQSYNTVRKVPVTEV